MPISNLIRFGTSTWAYEGWQGLVYHNSYAKGRFKQECLAEYARYEYHGEPMFRTAGLDQTFYRPPTTWQLKRYAEQLPSGFEMCSKVWEEITIPRFANHQRYGAKAGQPNPRFLDAKLFVDQVLSPYVEVFRGHTGPFLFEFQRMGIEPGEFLSRLDEFLGLLPKEFPYAIEIRNATLLGADYRSVLNTHGVAHVYNHWTYMPTLADQHQQLGQTFTAPFAVMRLLTPVGTKYEDAVKAAEPYNKLIKPLPTMRTEALDLIRKLVAEQRRAYVLVNNRAEGCAPLTVQALVDQLRQGNEKRSV